MRPDYKKYKRPLACDPDRCRLSFVRCLAAIGIRLEPRNSVRPSRRRESEPSHSQDSPLRSLLPSYPLSFAYNSVSWSISTELFFYLSFPQFLFLPRRRLLATFLVILVLIGLLLGYGIRGSRAKRPLRPGDSVFLQVRQPPGVVIPLADGETRRFRLGKVFSG